MDFRNDKILHMITSLPWRDKILYWKMIQRTYLFSEKEVSLVEILKISNIIKNWIFKLIKYLI